MSSAKNATKWKNVSKKSQVTSFIQVCNHVITSVLLYDGVHVCVCVCVYACVCMCVCVFLWLFLSVLL